MNLMQECKFTLKGHDPVWLIDVTFLLPVTAGRDVEWRIEEYSVDCLLSYLGICG